MDTPTYYQTSTASTEPILTPLSFGPPTQEPAEIPETPPRRPACRSCLLGKKYVRNECNYEKEYRDKCITKEDEPDEPVPNVNVHYEFENDYRNQWKQFIDAEQRASSSDPPNTSKQPLSTTKLSQSIDTLIKYFMMEFMEPPASRDQLIRWALSWFLTGASLAMANHYDHGLLFKMFLFNKPYAYLLFSSSYFVISQLMNVVSV